MHDTRTEAEVLESLGCAETSEHARLLMGLEASRPADLAPIARLQLAMIQEAINDILIPAGNAEVRAEKRETAVAWIAAGYRSGRTVADIITFEGCCLSLDIDPGWLRRLIHEADGSNWTRPEVRPHRTAGAKTRVRGPKREAA